MPTSKPESELLREELERRVLARNSLLRFTRYTFPSYHPSWHHIDLASKLTAFARGEIKKLMIFAPPRSGKSELVSRRLPAFIFGLNPDARIITASYGAALARRMGRSVQRIIATPEYQALFPAVRLREGNDSEARGFVRTADEFDLVGRRGGYICAGVGGALTGSGGDFLLIDDPVKDAADAWSEVVRESIWEWYTQVFLTRSEGDAGILLTMTRWHHDDLAGRILADAKPGEWEVVKFPALSPEYAQGALWPAKFPASWLEAMREKDRRGFAALYQQEPMIVGGNIWKPEQIKNGKPKRPHELFLFNVADLAYSQTKSSDFTAVACFAGDTSTGDLYLLDMLKTRIDITSAAYGGAHRAALEVMRSRHRAQYTIVESAAFASRIVEFMRRNGEPVQPVEADRSKAARAMAAMPVLDRGQLWADKEAPWWPDLEGELAAFTGNDREKNDQADVIAYGCIHWRDIWEPTMGLDLAEFAGVLTDYVP